MLRKAIEDCIRCRAEGLRAIRIAANVSSLQLRSRHFVEEIENAIRPDSNAAVRNERRRKITGIRIAVTQLAARRPWRTGPEAEQPGPVGATTDHRPVLSILSPECRRRGQPRHECGVTSPRCPTFGHRAPAEALQWRTRPAADAWPPARSTGVAATTISPSRGCCGAAAHRPGVACPTMELPALEQGRRRPATGAPWNDSVPVAVLRCTGA